MIFWLNLVGLVLNLIGAVVLYEYGAPARRYGFEEEIIPSLTEEEWKVVGQKMAKDRLVSRFGAGCIFFGFLLQLIALTVEHYGR